MSREQQTESQGQFDGSSPEAAAPPAHALQLPIHVYQQVVQIRPGDAVGLQALLGQHPELSQAIAQVASQHAGMSTVKQAMALQSSHAALPDSAPLPQGGTQADIRPGGEFALEGGPAAGKRPELFQDYRAGGAAELESAGPARPKVAHEPPWIVEARRYNDTHEALVNEFNELTDNVLALDERATNPQAISRWQRDHGLAADGKIGPHTVAAARAKRNDSLDVAKADTAPRSDKIDV
ncbi:MAG TPA: hypothetical protein VGC42_31225 [Kofleriaceae bacterium]